MRPLRGALLGVGAVATLFALAHSQGCGSSGGGSGVGDVVVGGNVSAVTDPPVAMAPAETRFVWWKIFSPSQAVAQACTAEDVFICLQTSQDVECSAVDESTCQFSVDIDVAGQMTVFFVKDEDNDGSPEEGEATSDLTNNLGDLCTGLTITLNDVAIDFDSGTSTAASVDRDPQSCPTPTETPGGNTPTPTATQGTPAPTATPTVEPTATPTP